MIRKFCALLAVTAFVIAAGGLACGDDTDDGDSDGTPTPTST